MIIPLTALLALTACDNIDEADRLIYVKPAAPARCVLIEDFTGQRCVNCPKATEVIEALQEQYTGSVVAVGIHSGPFARSATGTRYALGTDEGDEYYAHWRVDHQPAGIVNRTGVSDYTEWAAQVHNLIQVAAPLSIAPSASIADGRLSCSVELMAIDGNIDAKLQLWLVEDSVVAFQYLPDSSVDREYVHNHVLRAALNGTWGEHISVQEGHSTTVTCNYDVKPAWNTGHLSVVAFAYDDSGVLQAARAAVTNEPDSQ